MLFKSKKKSDLDLFISAKKKTRVKFSPVKWEDIKKVFFPKNFYEKYKYLGSVPWSEEGKIFKAMRPLVLLMDLKARPWWCPRWFLRFLHLFGSDNSIVRVRNFTLHNLEKKLTGGYMIWDYKTKWSEYDLRISIAGDEELMYLTDSIEEKFYRDGRKIHLIEILAEINSKESKEYQYYSLKDLEAKYEESRPKYYE